MLHEKQSGYEDFPIVSQDGDVFFFFFFFLLSHFLFPESETLFLFQVMIDEDEDD